MTIEQIKADVSRKMRAKMAAVDREALAAMYEEVGGYYGSGSPVMYVRTGTLATTPMTTGVSGGGMSVSTTAYLNTGIGYDTGTFSGEQVIDATNNGSAGTLGNSGYWERSVERIIAYTDNIFSNW